MPKHEVEVLPTKDGLVEVKYIPKSYGASCAFSYKMTPDVAVDFINRLSSAVVEIIK
jgi:hypothetical protein